MKIVLSIAALFAFNVAIGQNMNQADVPANVNRTFLTQYANATDVEWEMDDDHYEVEFETPEGEHEMLIDKNGKVVMHKGEISEADLPIAVKNALSSKYADREVEDVEIIRKDGKTYYEVELDGKVFDDEILFEETGEVKKSNDSWYKF